MLAELKFHFTKQEPDAILHLRAIVSKGRISGMEVDPDYFRLLGGTSRKFIMLSKKGRKTSFKMFFFPFHSPFMRWFSRLTECNVLEQFTLLYFTFSNFIRRESFLTPSNSNTKKVNIIHSPLIYT